MHSSTALADLLKERIVILDGAMGTMIQRYKLGEVEYRGARFADFAHDVKGNNELLVLTQPQIIQEIHEQYLEAGADVVETNTFGATRIAQADYHMEDLAYEMNVAAAKLAKAACAKFEKAGAPRFAAGAFGPTPKTASISPDVNDPAARNVTFDQLVAAYLEQARALAEGGVDLFLVETIFDTLNAKAALFAIDEYFAQAGVKLPIMISGTITDASGRTLSGQTAEAFWNSVRHAKPLSVGFNCALGAKQLRPHVEELARIADVYVSAHPNAGLPNDGRIRRAGRRDRGLYPRVGRERLAQHHRRLLRHHPRPHQGDRRDGVVVQAAHRAHHRAEAAPLRPRAPRSESVV